MARNVLILGASYGSLLATKLLMAGHNVTLVCRKKTAELINRDGTEVRIKLRDEAVHRAIFSRDLQGTLAERDEEIAGLRADVAFYERFVGPTAQRHGLAVHQMVLERQDGGAWHFTATLTQNLNRGAVNSGTLTLWVEGSRDGKLQKLSWAQLRQQPAAAGVAYSFKYFQQVEGDILLPAGLQPIRVVAHLDPQRGAAVEQSFGWAEATGQGPGGG